MSGSKKRFLYVMLLLTIFSIIGAFIEFFSSDTVGPIPLLGLDYPIHLVLVNIVWPILGSAVFAVLFPRIFVPFFLVIKKYIAPGFKNAEISVDTKPNRLGKWFSRSVYVALLVFGLQAFLLNIFPHELLLTPTQHSNYSPS